MTAAGNTKLPAGFALLVCLLLSSNVCTSAHDYSDPHLINAKKAIKVEPGSADAHRELGFYKLDHKDLVGANTELCQTLTLNPDDKEAGQKLVDLWQEQVTKSPGANSHFGLARAFQLSGDLDGAQKEYRTVVQLDPENPALPMARASFHRALARQEAQKDLQQAEVLESQGHIPEAYQLVSQAMVYSPGNTSYKLYQAELLTKLGQPGMAKQIYLNILKNEPENQTALQCLRLLASGGAMVPGTNIPLPANITAANAAPANSGTNDSASRPPVSTSSVESLSAFLAQLKVGVLDPKEAAGADLPPITPTTDPAGQLHAY